MQKRDKMYALEMKASKIISVKSKSEMTWPQKRNCLCSQINHLFVLSQIIGINPLTFRCNHDPRIFECYIEKRFLSRGFVFSMALVCFLLVTSPMIHIVLHQVAPLLYKGTDEQAFILQFQILVGQNLVIVFSAYFLSDRFVKSWNILRKVVYDIENMKKAAINFPPKTKRWSKRLAVTLSVFAIGSIIYVSLFASFLCTINLFKAHCSYYFRIASLNSGAIELFGSSLASLCLVYAYLIRDIYKELNNVLENVLLNSSEKYDCRKSKDIEMIRILHENICDAANLSARFFGFPCLTICCCSVLSIVCGCYFILLFKETQMGNGGRIYVMGTYGIFLFITGFAFLTLIFILYSGQIISDSSMESARILHKSNLNSLDSSAQFQVSLFLHKISAFPSNYNFCSVVNIGFSFLASASTNIVTYVLVLMQFRMDNSN